MTPPMGEPLELQTVADQLLWGAFLVVVLLTVSLSALLLMELRNQ